MPGAEPLQLLLLEDSAIDAELVGDALRAAGVAMALQRVETEADYTAILAKRLPDAILADWSLPGFSGAAALTIARQNCPEVPFIFVSGTIEENTALTALRRGATDYVYKHQLDQLPPALERALTEARMRQALQEREAELLEAQRLASIGSWVWAIRTDAHSWSEETYRIYGRDQALPPAVYPEVQKYFTAESWANLAAAVEQCLANGLPYECDAEVVRPDGSHRWVTARGQGRRDADGKIVALHGTVQDITARKQAEAALRESEERLHHALSATQEGVWDRDLRTGRVKHNRQWCDLLGFTDELIEHPVEFSDELIHPDDREMVHARMEAAVHGRARYEAEYRLRRNDGSYLWVADNGRPVASDADGQSIRIVGTIANVTQRRQAEETLVERERAFRTLADNVPDNIARFDCAGRFLYANKTLERTLGCSVGEILGKTLGEVHPDGCYDAVEKAVRRVSGSGAAENFALLVPGPDGQPRHYVIHIVPEPGPAGRLISVLAVGRDVTTEMIAEQELRLAAIAFDAQVGTVITDAKGVILRVNRALTETTGYTAEDAIGQTPRLFKSNRHDTAFYSAMWESLRLTGAWQGEIWDRRKNGEIYPNWMIITSVKGNDGVLTHYVSTQTDITERKAAEEGVKHLALYDPLTGLPNRRLLLDRLKQALAMSARSQRQGALLFIDLDNFKMLNDTLGHDKGDLLLQRVADRLSSCMRQCDTVSRLGGDEFVVLLEDLSETRPEAAMQSKIVGEKILAALEQTYWLNGHEHCTTSSIGVTLFGAPGDTMESLLKQADLAMYQAKAAGRNALRFFDPAMQAVSTHVA